VNLNLTQSLIASIRLAIFIACIATRCTQAQTCAPLWDNQYPIAWGVDGTVLASTIWDADGAGPASPMLVIAGSFRAAGSAPANNIAAWNPDTAQWQAFGAGTNNQINALAVYNEQLIAAGAFTTAGGASALRIARWNATASAWQPLGSGLAGAFSPTALSLSVFQNQLIVGGTFTIAGGQSANRIARWNGTNWQPLGTGMSSTVRALIEHNGDLVAGGSFNVAGGNLAYKIAKWNGTSWSPIGAGFGELVATVHSLTHFGGVLIAGGSDFFGNPLLERWHGNQWVPMNKNLPEASIINALLELDGQLYAGGTLSGFDGAYVYQWIGAEDLASGFAGNWQSLGSGFSIGCCVNDSLPPEPTVRTLILYDNSVVAAGLFDHADGTPAGNLAQLHFPAEKHDPAWQPFGQPSQSLNWPALAMVEYNGDLVAGGSFTAAGAFSANFIARFDSKNQRWSPIGGGVNDWVRALAIYNGDLIAAGDFTVADGQPANHIARWNEAAAKWQPLGSGLSDNVWALTVYNGELIAGGDFTSAGGNNANRVARWNDSTSSWTAVQHSNGSNGVNNDVFALGVFDNQLIIGGAFTQAGGQPAVSIVSWDGNAFQAMPANAPPPGGGLAAGVYSIAVYDGALIAGGMFTQISGTTTPVKRVAKWTGAAWQQIADGIDGTSNTAVLALATFAGDLYAGINIGPSGSPMIHPRIKRWNPTQTTWQSVGTGTNAAVNALALYNNQLAIAGNFTVANDKVAGHWCTLRAPAPSDVDCDGDTDVHDLLSVLNNWGACADPNNCPADIAPPAPPAVGNDIVDVDDLMMVIAGWS
jgi:trimeric autotransporter adhesin